MLALVIFGGGGLLRLTFQDETHTSDAELWLYFIPAAIGLVLLLTGVARSRR